MTAHQTLITSLKSNKTSPQKEHNITYVKFTTLLQKIKGTF